MAIATSNPFSVGIWIPPTFSMPTIQDERDTYALWGWTWTEATANPNFASDPSYDIPANEDLHYNPEGDDLWAYLQAYTRRGSGASFAGYKKRADEWRDYWVNAPQLVNEDSPPDHMCLWGLVEYAQRYNDSAALSAALSLCTTKLYDVYSVINGGTWYVPGVAGMAYWGHRYHARNLKNAVVVADATSNANIIVLRDKLLDLWIQSSDWDETRGMYWIGQESFVGAGFEDPPYNLSYAAGDRFIAPLHVATLADAFYTAWLSPNVSAGRKASVRDKIIKMATWLNANGVEWSYGYSSSFIGMYGAGGSWRSYAFQDPVTFWDGVHTNSLVNIQVMAYKFTGNHDFLDATAADGLYPAKYCFNRGTKGLYGEPTARECADNVAGHFQDTVFDSSMFNRYLKFNKGELQTTYLIFENGGAPIVFS